MIPNSTLNSSPDTQGKDMKGLTMEKRIQTASIRLTPEQKSAIEELPNKTTPVEPPKTAYERGVDAAKGMVAQTLLKVARENNLIRKSVG